MKEEERCWKEARQQIERDRRFEALKRMGKEEWGVAELQESEPEIPWFSGEDVHGWVTKVERYFRLKGVSNAERVQAIMGALEGRALSWFQWWQSCFTTLSWESFKIGVIRRF